MQSSENMCFRTYPKLHLTPPYRAASRQRYPPVVANPHGIPITEAAQNDRVQMNDYIGICETHLPDTREHALKKGHPHNTAQAHTARLGSVTPQRSRAPPGPISSASRRVLQTTLPTSDILRCPLSSASRRVLQATLANSDILRCISSATRHQNVVRLPSKRQIQKAI